MNKPPGTWIRRVAALAFFFSIATAGWAEHEEPVQILILTDTNQRSGPFVKVSNAFTKELLERELRPVVLRYIDLNANDVKGISDESVYRLLVERVFHPAPPDLVIALGPPAVEFWQRNSGEAFEHVPVLACAAEVGGVDPEYASSQWAVIARYSFASQIADVLELLPDTRQIYLVTGASPHERRMGAVALEQIQAEFGNLELELSSDLTLNDVTSRVSKLEPGSVVYYVTFESDAAGAILHDDESLKAVSAASSVPVFGPFREQVGLGIAGGKLIPLEETGQELAKVARGILSGEPPARGIHYVDLGAPLYDWRQLKERGIPSHHLPSDSELLFKPPGLWESYSGWIVSIAVLNAAMAWLIFQLAIQRRRSRRQADTNAVLSRRLITAYEDERRLIAREMHDDVCQSLARLGIDASLITVGADSQGSVEKLSKLQDGLSRVSSYVHELSYRIHPSMVDELGLANALRAECALMQAHTDVPIESEIDETSSGLPSAVRLNLYRIGQEALQNAIRHSGASQIQFQLACDDRNISLTVSDNGHGFDVNNGSGTFSLGLASMRERAALAGGQLTIHSSREEGTRVHLSVPLQGAGK